MNPYEKCPVFENENFLLRLVNDEDVQDLLLVYSDEKAVPYFNSDNCNGDDFHYTSLERMKNAVDFWKNAYGFKAFVRWTIIDKNIGKAIGTIELFNRCADDYFNNCGIMRLDLRSDYEDSEKIKEILSIILQSAFDLFNCTMIATKVPDFADERKAAVTDLKFIYSNEKLIGGDDKKEYSDYYVLQK